MTTAEYEAEIRRLREALMSILGSKDIEGLAMNVARTALREMP